MQPKPFPESQNHGDWRESKSRRPFFRSLLERMADVTKNPPLACYYGAAVGQVAGWSERAFHLAFLVPALALVLGTYRLAKHFTRFPL
jgi:hypothetical protein